MSQFATTYNEFSLRSESSIPSRKRCRREGGKWTRSGCLTCKRRRKRCDEAKPGCQNCARLGLSCEGYGSVWAKPLDPGAQVFQQVGLSKRRRISRSHSASVGSDGSSQDHPSPKLTSFPSNSLNTSCSSMSKYDADETRWWEVGWRIADNRNDTEKSVTAPHNDRSGVITKSFGYISHLTALETLYLQYYVERGSKLLANLENEENPLRSLLIPRAHSSPLLMNALCALSAIHLANRTSDSLCAQTAAADYYIQTMRGVRIALTERSTDKFPEDALLSVALLCKFEIVRGSVKQWTVHLHALGKLILSRGGFDSLSQDTAHFLRGLDRANFQFSFVYGQNLAKLTNPRLITAALSDLNHAEITRLDIYIGYTERIIKLCARIADLPLLYGDPVALGLEIHTIDESLRNWTKYLPSYIIPKGTTEENLTRLHMVAECFCNAAYIYLHSTLERMMRGLTQRAFSIWTSFISLSKRGAVERCLRTIRSSPLDDHCEYSALTFPLFITGCECEETIDRELIMRSLTQLEGNFGIGNVKRAKELLNILWTGEKLHWLDVLEHLKWDLILT
ncbi:Zn(II)2Cys6 transcription factor [Aspergillus novofumigatus IBT 16806]|uniref:Putative C6 transcription factor n=1 Tax=Aspergillus novofumigatus (strain IBT 16806) TaxID=1392255 RepID=A0A2I1BZM7_ASPN1|nr:putative C6 transcription factor [Aspergillus novofumigatus IBT 16806]PKX90829.1 putative C6 transcription factor [Aspergillus novofumigatus IBT 16806]